MKSLIIFMAVVVALSSVLSLFGFVVVPSFVKTMSTFGNVIDVFNFVFVDPFEDLIKTGRYLLTDDIECDVYIRDDKDVQGSGYLSHSLYFKDHLVGVKYCIKFTYKPLKNSAYGVTAWYQFINNYKENHSRAVYMCFDEHGEFMHFIAIYKAKSLDETLMLRYDGFATGSFYSSSGNVAAVYFQNYVGIDTFSYRKEDILAFGEDSLCEFDTHKFRIYTNYKGNLTDMAKQYVSTR